MKSDCSLNKTVSLTSFIHCPFIQIFTKLSCFIYFGAIIAMKINTSTEGAKVRTNNPTMTCLNKKKSKKKTTNSSL